MNIKIRVRDLFKKYEQLIAVDHVSFDIFNHEIFGLLGPNGAGKTTTISMICGLTQPDSGSIDFEGGKNLKQLIGYCPQENVYYPKLTCFEQLQFIGCMYGLGKNVVRARSMELLDMLELKDKADVLASKLSGGMKRRLNICMALVHYPQILILDEPEAGLDPQSKILVRDFIKSIAKQLTVILTTHNMDEADRMCDRIAIIDYGKILCLDSPYYLKKKVGEGDVLELSFRNKNSEAISQFMEEMALMQIPFKMNNDTFFIRHSYIIDHLPAIKNVALNKGLIIAELRLRENTLEDVFIYLTGRKLRQ